MGDGTVERQSRSTSASSSGRLGREGRRAGRRWRHRSGGDTAGCRLKEEAERKRPREKDEKAWQKKGKRKFCIFCKDQIDYIDYKDVITLRKFVSERGKIRARRVTGNCVQHQRDVATGGQERARDGAADLLEPMKVILQKPVDKLGVPGRRRRCCRRLRAQLPDPPGLAVKASKNTVNHADSLRRAHESAATPEGRVRSPGIEVISGGPSASRPRPARKASCSARSPPDTSPRRSRPQSGRPHRPADVRLDEPIRSIGTHEVKIHLFTDVEPIITVEVEPEG